MVRVKICGVRDEAGARGVGQARADFAGLLFVPGRRRSVSIDDARTLIPLLRPAEPVGVFRDARPCIILNTAEALGIRTIQLHGSEPPSLARQLRAEGLRIIRAVSAPNGIDPALFETHRTSTDVFLLDGANPGSGQRIPLFTNEPRRSQRTGGTRSAQTSVSLLERALSDFAGRPVWLAGGLTPENVRRSILLTGANGVDVASGVEREGVQDASRIMHFVEAARGLRS